MLHEMINTPGPGCSVNRLCIDAFKMSSNPLPRSNKSQKSSALVRQEAGDPEMHEKLSVTSSGSNYDGDRESGVMKKPRVISQRKSQLPQRSSARQSTMMRSEPLADANVSNMTKETPREPGTESNYVNFDGSFRHQTVADKPVQRYTKSMLPPMKPAGRSVSVKTQDSNRTPSSVVIQRSASTRADSGVLRPGISRSSSQARPSVTGMAKPAKKISVYQANHENALPAPEAPQIGLAIGQSSKSRTDQIHSHTRYSSELKPVFTADTVSAHTRSRTQELPKLSLSDPSLLPTTKTTSRKTSRSFQLQQRVPSSTSHQHFSPKKILKVPTTLFLPATNKHSATHELSNGDIQIQAELIQLHLLLRSAAEVQHLWERSAKLCLQSHFKLVREKHVELGRRIKSQQDSQNHSALVVWCDAMSRLELAEKLQLLSHNISDIVTLSESGGKFTRVLDSFEPWFSRAHRIRNSRKKPPGSVGWDPEFIESIGDEWKLEVATLEMKLASYSRELRNAVMPQVDSNLACFLLSFQKLVGNLLEELGVMQGIERDVMADEKAWIESAIPKFLPDADDSLKPMSSSSYQGIWHGKV